MKAISILLKKLAEVRKNALTCCEREVTYILYKIGRTLHVTKEKISMKCTSNAVIHDSRSYVLLILIIVKTVSLTQKACQCRLNLKEAVNAFFIFL